MIKSSKEETIDIFKLLGTLLYNKQYVECDKILSELKVKDLSTCSMRSYLVITHNAKNFLPSRPNLYSKIYDAMCQLKGKQATEHLLSRLI